MRRVSHIHSVESIIFLMFSPQTQKIELHFHDNNKNGIKLHDSSFLPVNFQIQKNAMLHCRNAKISQKLDIQKQAIRHSHNLSNIIMVYSITIIGT